MPTKVTRWRTRQNIVENIEARIGSYEKAADHYYDRWQTTQDEYDWEQYIQNLACVGALKEVKRHL